MTGAYSGLLVDFGGVMTTSVIESFGAFCELEGIEQDLFLQTLLTAARAPQSPFHAIELGTIDSDEFDRRLSELLTTGTGVSVSAEDLKNRLFAGTAADERMIAAIRTLRGHGVRTGLVSNSWGGEGYPRHLFPDLFDAVVISGEVGLRKPDDAIYLMAADRIGVAPESCVFIDDFRINIKGAEAVGMTGIHHERTDDTLQLLERYFGVRLTEPERS